MRKYLIIILICILLLSVTNNLFSKSNSLNDLIRFQKPEKELYNKSIEDEIFMDNKYVGKSALTEINESQNYLHKKLIENIRVTIINPDPIIPSNQVNQYKNNNLFFNSDEYRNNLNYNNKEYYNFQKENKTSQEFEVPIKENIKVELYYEKLKLKNINIKSTSKGPTLANSPWPMFRQNLKHTGLSPFNTSSNSGKMKWNFSTNFYVFSSPAIDSNGTIYVGSHDKNLYAIYPNGTEKWNITIGRVRSSPAISSDGTIYVGSFGKKLHAVNPNGTLKWIFLSIINDFSSSPAIGSNGTIYIGSEDHKLYAINPNGTEKWSFKTGNVIASSPAIGSNGTIYIGSTDNKLYAINPDGTEKWSFYTGDWILWSSPAIGFDNTIYVGSRDNKLYAINSNGTEKWNFMTNDNVYSSPAIGSDGTIYVGSIDHKLYAINSNGIEKWNFTTGDNVESSPAIGADGTIYVGSNDNRLYAIYQNGTEKWNFTTGDWVWSSPAIGADGMIYVGSKDGKLYAIGTPNTPPIAAAGPNQIVNEGYVVHLNGSASYDPDSSIVKYVWDFENDGIFDYIETVNNSPDGIFDGKTSHIYPDNGLYQVILNVTDDDGLYDTDFCNITVQNIAPTANLKILYSNITTNLSANLSIRIAGEKWHDVQVELYREGILAANKSLIRSPSSPNQQMLYFPNHTINSSVNWSAILRYTPEDDPINGKPNGATPCWVFLNLSNNEKITLHHTFNVKHQDTYTWIINLTKALIFKSNYTNVTFCIISYDPGADNLTLNLNFGDGINITRFYPNINQTFPIAINITITHNYYSTGPFMATLIAKDDDGEITFVTVPIDVG